MAGAPLRSGDQHSPPAPPAPPWARLQGLLGPSWAVVAGAAAVAVGGAGIGLGSFLLQSYFNQRYLDGGSLAGWQNFLREGSPWQALAPVILAGLLALIGRVRLESAPPEPAIGLRSLEGAPVPRLRSALRRERRVVTATLTALSALVLVVFCRLAVYLGLTAAGSGLARATLLGVAIEAVVWGLCWCCFWLWRRAYLARLESWGVSGAG